VKNRCKNGDYYWVTANVSPVTEHGQVTGYISVRYKPSAQEIAAAEKLYAQINAGKSSLKASFLSRTMSALWGNRSVTQRLLGVLNLVCITMIGAAYLFSQMIVSGVGSDTLINTFMYGVLGSIG